ncbi:MAG TPA: TMEM165/GDT1 family protein [Pseudonocardiaceae bacterium]|nr:TMEM165/GDT1 family protein [Pseudonocardiaceae bacterium]
MSLGLLAAVFGIIFVAELPDKTALASLVLGTRYRPSFVFIGMAAAFALHVIIAVAAGSLLGLAPRPMVEAVVALLFLAGAAMLLWRAGHERDESAEPVLPPVPGAGHGDAAAGAVLTKTRVPATTRRRAGFWTAVSASFGVLFVAEFGDLTQIVIANLAAKYHDLLAVSIGATLGLWAVGGLAILGGRQLLRWIPLVWVTRAAGLVMTVLGVLSAIHAVTG